MSFGENSDQFLNGLKNIENKISEDLLGVGIGATLDFPDFRRRFLTSNL